MTTQRANPNLCIIAAACAALAILFAPISGCASPLAHGPIMAHELAELHEPEFEAYDAVEIRHRDDGVTYGFIAHDGILVEPVSTDDEAWIRNPRDRAERMIERLGDESIPMTRRMILAF